MGNLLQSFLDRNTLSLFGKCFALNEIELRNHIIITDWAWYLSETTLLDGIFHRVKKVNTYVLKLNHVKEKLLKWNKHVVDTEVALQSTIFSNGRSGRCFWRSAGSTSCSKQIQSDQAAYGLVHSKFEYLWGWRFQNLSKQSTSPFLSSMI